MNNVENLKDIYRNLYGMNLEAAEDDYLEYYESNFSPDNLDGCETADEVVREIRHLVGEIMDDTGSEKTTREWLIDAGADDELVAACGL